ncbi:hypothetical protein ITP31_004780 [Salmonella enterica]|nr:hypothetical protein [Salmonella enterica]
MKTANTTEVKIVIPFNYDKEPGRLLIDFKDKLSIDFEGANVVEAYYASMAEEIVVRAHVDSELITTLMSKYRKGESVIIFEEKNVDNGRLEVINRAKWL